MPPIMIEQTLDSREVATMVVKEHKNLMRDIRSYVSELAELKIEPVTFFKENTYNDANNQSRPCYSITKKGCEFIAHKLTGIKETEFTAKYITRFHEMEETLACEIDQNKFLQQNPEFNGGNYKKSFLLQKLCLTFWQTLYTLYLVADEK